MDLSSLDDITADILLIQNPHIISIIQEPPRISPEINLEYFQPERHESATQVYHDIQKLLMNPYIFDDFGNQHEQRREWRKTLDKKCDDLIKRNCMRVGPASGVLTSCVLLGRYFGDQAGDKQKKKLDALQPYFKIFQKYNALHEQDKYELIIKFKQQVYQFLVSLSVRKQEQEAAIPAA